MTSPEPMSTGDSPARPVRDRRFDQLLSRVLIGGTVAAGCVIGLGAVAVVRVSGRTTASFAKFDPSGATDLSVASVLRKVAAMDARSILLLGVLLVIATPVVRVAFSMVTFAIERDRLYVLVTATVLAVLGYSLLFAV